ncbi:MAG TPA: two-component system response regulator, partial [Planctomycetaceae bacterium]|nr:two-component system response regulator [Planctomycetaceae bacterium]
DWPGNVRELENAVERAVILTPGEYVSEKDLPPALTQHFESVCGASDSPQSLGGKSLQEIEKVAIEE